MYAKAVPSADLTTSTNKLGACGSFGHWLQFAEAN